MAASEFALRAPIPADYAELASWIGGAVACARWAGPQLPYPFSADDLPHLLEREGTTSSSLIDGGGRLAGFGQLIETDAGIVRLARIIVAPRCRSRGVGKRLCELLLNDAAARPDVKEIRLLVYRDNAAAFALYSRLGFVECPPHPRPEVLTMAVSASLIRSARRSE